MRVWIDITNSPHVPFFRPLIDLLHARGDDVIVSAREYAQTLELLDDVGIAHTVVGPAHGGASAYGKAKALGGRLLALRQFARGRRFDVALSHASHELPLTARSLGIPSAYAFDYEFARLQHTLGCIAATRVVVPDIIPADRLHRLRAPDRKLRRFPGLKEEYYLGAFEPDPGALDAVGVDRSRVVVVVRTPPDVSAYHRHGNPVFPDVLQRLGSDPEVHAVVLPRTAEQRAAISGLGLPSLIVPERAIDAPSLVASADLVVSAGGTMNREAVALGVPVYTVFAGTLGAVDAALERDGRLRGLTSADDLDLSKRTASAERVRRDPALLLDLMVG
jgi:uncharacterized protein